MANKFLPPNFHVDAPVIEIDGVCWIYKQPSAETPTVQELDGVYQTCEQCLASPTVSPSPILPSPSPIVPSPSVSPEPPPLNSCNSCDPAIPDTLYVTLAGVPGKPDGTYEVNWQSGCTWNNPPDPVPDIGLSYSGGSWYVDVFFSTNVWSKAGNPCNPEGGTYVLETGSGTASVSLTP